MKEHPRYQERRDGWRPTRDLARCHRLERILPGQEAPATPEAALAHVRDLCLSEVVAYDGYPKLQADLVADKARLLFPGAFGAAEPPEQSPAPAATHNAVEAFYERHTGQNGRIDWEAVANDTHYVVYSTPLPIEQGAVVETPLRPSPAVMVDLSARTG